MIKKAMAASQGAAEIESKQQQEEDEMLRKVMEQSAKEEADRINKLAAEKTSIIKEQVQITEVVQ